MRSRPTSMFAAVALVATLTGCTFIADQTVQTPYDPSDGFGTRVGGVDVRNVLLITEDGETANLLVNLINTSDENVAMSLSWESSTGRTDRNLYVAAGATKSFGDPSNQIVIRGLDAELGSLFPVYFQYGDNEGSQLDVPVLDGGLPEYSDLVPLTTDTTTE